MYVYLLGLAVSNLCVMISALPALVDISEAGFNILLLNKSQNRCIAKFSYLKL